ncbi:MAG TPA: peptidoglycan-binding domain-containing protein [Candidatus Limnocylindrales bacterium]|nr:peptidoglycan-binding domain-containing protein [Candidatus Limnocylindrales bacterium]
MAEPRPPDDDWQLDDVDWFDHRRRPGSQTAAGEAPPRQRSGLIPEAGRGAGDDPAGAARHADIRRRRIAALAVLGGLFVLAVVIPLVVFAGGGGGSAELTVPPTTPLTTTTLPTTTQTRTTTTTATTPTTPSTALRVTLPSGTSLNRGDTGAAVTQLQKGLVALGFSAGTPDGKFGAATEAAVVDFQQSNNLTPDGIVGTETVRLLNKALAAQAAG